MRNSSLVEKTCAENVTGLKHDTEAEECLKTLVEEHWIRNEAVPEGAVECIEERMPE